MSTKRLDLEEPYLERFEARVLEVRETGRPAAAAVVLDRTAFYPGGGGQPADRGFIGGCVVSGASPDPADPGTILHLLAPGRRPALEPGSGVECRLDWAWRFELMQQHTGQHIVSALVLERHGAPTTGFHLTAETATVDLAFPDSVRSSPEALDEALGDLEAAACQVVFESRPVRLHLAPPGEAPDGVSAGVALRLREHGPAPKGGETWRLVEVEGLDLSPCGGTHVRSTGEVGLITLERFERIREGVRLEFACGVRSLRVHRRRRRALALLARQLSAQEGEAVDLALKGLAGAAAQARRVHELEQAMLGLEAERLRSGAEVLPGGMLVRAVLRDQGADALKLLATMIAQGPRTVALLATGGEPPRLAFARSADLDGLHAGRLLAAAAAAMDGRGGGSPRLGQGGGGDPGRLSAALAEAEACARTLLGQPRSGPDPPRGPRDRHAGSVSGGPPRLDP